jgi:NAD(P)-dependent dehydrogenase (short-subunit alcohol dehydrogenase family)
MSLLNQTAWVVGGVGVVGRGITRGLLQAGATVIVNSRSEERLATIQDTLGNPERLIAVHGSLLPGSASKTVADTLDKHGRLNHVVAHGAVRWWARPTAGKYEYYEYRAGCDESYALNIRASEKLLSMSPEEFASSSAQLATLHFSAAQQLMPRLQPAAAGKAPSYTFVTGDGSGKPGGERTAMGEINSHHVWGLSAALRKETEGELLNVREIRVGLPVPAEDRDAERPLSEDVGDLCAGLAAAASNQYDHGRLIKLDDFEELNHMLHEYHVTGDGRIGSLPRYLCDQGELSGSL